MNIRTTPGAAAIAPVTLEHGGQLLEVCPEGAESVPNC